MNDIYYYLGLVVFWIYSVAGCIYVSIVTLDFIGLNILKVFYKLCRRIGILFEYAAYRHEFKEWINTYKRNVKQYFRA